MSAPALLTDKEVAEVLEVSPRQVRARAEEFRTELAGAPSRNGVHRRLYHAGSLPPDAQAKWARGNNVIAFTPASAPGQMAAPARAARSSKTVLRPRLAAHFAWGAPGCSGTAGISPAPGS